VPEGESLQYEADRDKDLVDLLLRDAKHLGPTVRIEDDKSFLLQLPECLRDWPAADRELRRHVLLDDPVARLQVPAHDRLPKDIRDTVS
jgi:hypothetical protein